MKSILPPANSMPSSDGSHIYAACPRDLKRPVQASTDGWIGHPARAVFAKFHRALSGQADDYIDLSFISVQGLLQGKRTMTGRRVGLLKS